MQPIFARRSAQCSPIIAAGLSRLVTLSVLGDAAQSSRVELVFEALFSKTRRRVLGLLFGSPHRSFYANEIMRHADCGIGAVQRELERLAAAGLVNVSRAGNKKHYKANMDAPLFEELRSIVSKSALSAVESLNVEVDALSAVCKEFHVRKLSVFGSAARGELNAGSDIDVLVEFDPAHLPTLWGMVRLQQALESVFGRQVDVATDAILRNPHRRRGILADLKELYAA